MQVHGAPCRTRDAGPGHRLQGSATYIPITCWKSSCSFAAARRMTKPNPFLQARTFDWPALRMGYPTGPSAAAIVSIVVKHARLGLEQGQVSARQADSEYSHPGQPQVVAAPEHRSPGGNPRNRDSKEAARDERWGVWGPQEGRALRTSNPASGRVGTGVLAPRPTPASSELSKKEFWQHVMRALCSRVPRLIASTVSTPTK